MKNKISLFLFLLLLIADILYFVLISDSFYQEYIADTFVYWGYPQWGWLYSDQNTYLIFNLSYLFILLLCILGCIWFYRKKSVKFAWILVLLPIISAAVSWYMPFYNWNKQFEIYMSEKGNDKSRIPAGKWWASAEQMQKYYDASAWERLKGCFGRGEWPGGYALWGDYRMWLLPDLATDTKGRRGMVIHGGTQKASPWGIDMGDNVIDFAIRLRQAKKAIPMNVNYSEAQNSQEDSSSNSIESWNVDDTKVTEE